MIKNIVTSMWQGSSLNLFDKNLNMNSELTEIVSGDAKAGTLQEGQSIQL